MIWENVSHDNRLYRYKENFTTLILISINTSLAIFPFLSGLRRPWKFFFYLVIIDPFFSVRHPVLCVPILFCCFSSVMADLTFTWTRRKGLCIISNSYWYTVRERQESNKPGRTSYFLCGTRPYRYFPRLSESALFILISFGEPNPVNAIFTFPMKQWLLFDKSRRLAGYNGAMCDAKCAFVLARYYATTRNGVNRWSFDLLI